MAATAAAVVAAVVAKASLVHLKLSPLLASFGGPIGGRCRSGAQHKHEHERHIGGPV